VTPYRLNRLVRNPLMSNKRLGKNSIIKKRMYKVDPILVLTYVVLFGVLSSGFVSFGL
jgi:hypothetical protein